MKEGEGIGQRTYMHSHGHGRQCGEGQGRGGQGEEMGDICDNVNSKDKFKNSKPNGGGVGA